MSFKADVSSINPSSFTLMANTWKVSCETLYGSQIYIISSVDNT